MKLFNEKNNIKKRKMMNLWKSKKVKKKSQKIKNINFKDIKLEKKYLKMNLKVEIKD